MLQLLGVKDDQRREQEFKLEHTVYVVAWHDITKTAFYSCDCLLYDLNVFLYICDSKVTEINLNVFCTQINGETWSCIHWFDRRATLLLSLTITIRLET